MFKKGVLTTKIVYENSLLNHFQGHHHLAINWIRKVIKGAQEILMHESLPMNITLKVTDISYKDIKFKNKTINANAEIYKFLARDQQPSSLTAYFCKQIKYGRGDPTGFTTLNSACRDDGYGLLIVELYNLTDPIRKSAKTFAHELGHSIGM